MNMLVPTYRRNLEKLKPTNTIRWCWSPEAVEMLRDCLDSTDWGNSIDEYTDTLTSYVSSCEDVNLPEGPRVRVLRATKDQAYRSVHREELHLMK